MKRTICSVAMLALVGVAGCANKKTESAPAADLTPPPAPVAYQPAAPAVTATPQAPAAIEATAAPAPAETSASGGTKYVVQKGDNLYQIAKKKYGRGSDYTKILAANPGLTPEKLQAGKTIILP